MYRDDRCAVCGASLPPDHFYCREHADGVDDRLHELGELLSRFASDADRLGELLGQVADETWDYVAEQDPDDPPWPPVPTVLLRAAPEHVDVDVDTEPGLVRVTLGMPLAELVTALADALDTPALLAFAAACARARGANATH